MGVGDGGRARTRGGKMEAFILSLSNSTDTLKVQTD